jgi:hypothetical protein
VRGLPLIGAVVFVVACAVFAIARTEPQPPYPKADVVGAAQRDARVRTELRGSGWDEARVIPLDRKHWRVSFFDGPRQVLDVAVDPRGGVDAIEVHRANAHPAGSSTLWRPPVLLLFAALFVFALATPPLLSLRNLDAVVITAGFTASAFLLDDRLVGAHVYAGGATLAYVAVRCARTAFGRVAPRPAREPATPRFEHYVPLVTAGALVAAVLIVVTSDGISDVAFAGLAGGTLLNHGISPYGHITTEVVHGDTYPLLTYVLYMPFAAISPVRDSFDSLDGGLWLNAIALVAGALLIRRLDSRKTLAWLAFPPVLLAASGGGNDVPAAAFVIAALAAFGRERLTAALFALAGWVKIAPALMLVPWLARLRGRARKEALALVAGLLAAGIVAILAVGGGDALHKAVDALRFQFERGSWFSVWRQLGAPAVQVVCQALTVALIVVAAIYAHRNRDISLQRLAGLGGAILALVQLSANYWTYAYLPWLLPFILVALFPPAPRRSPRPEPRAP